VRELLTILAIGGGICILAFGTFNSSMWFHDKPSIGIVLILFCIGLGFFLVFWGWGRR